MEHDRREPAHLGTQPRNRTELGWRCGRPRQRPRPGSPVRPGRERGARGQTTGRSRGGQTFETHALTDVLGRPGVLLLAPSNASDVTTTPIVLAEAPGWIRRLSSDKGCDADWVRTDLRNSEGTPVIPGKCGRKRRIYRDNPRYRKRWRIEAMVNRLKNFRRPARYRQLTSGLRCTATEHQSCIGRRSAVRATHHLPYVRNPKGLHGMAGRQDWHRNSSSPRDLKRETFRIAGRQFGRIIGRCGLCDRKWAIPRRSTASYRYSHVLRSLVRTFRGCRHQS